MACLYCGGDVPLRMRLTGEDRFCCPEHRRLYNEEHTRIGLARLLEEAGASVAVETSGAAPASPRAADAEGADEPKGEALPEPELVSSGGGLRLWLFPHLPHRPDPQFQKFLAPDAEPIQYEPQIPESHPEARPSEPDTQQPALGRADNTGAAVGATAVTAPPVEQPTRLEKPAPPQQSPGREPPTGEQAAPKKSPTAALPAPPTAEHETVEQKKEDDEGAAEAIPVPAFSSYEETASGRSWLRIAAGVVLALAAGAGGYYWYSGGRLPVPSTTAQTESTWKEWIPNWARSAGGEEIALFGPSLDWTDYRVQWRANPNEEVAWVYRAVDPQNYYVLRLELTRYGTWKIVRYALIDGRRTPPEERVLSQRLPDERRVAVQLEVRGSDFRLYVDGHNVASWQDERLRRGGFGVIRPDAGLAGIGNVTVTQLQGNPVQEGRFWRGLHPEQLPEVTLLGERSEPPVPHQDDSEESNL